MILRTTMCPHCGYKLENMVPTAREKIGAPVLPCPNCQQLYGTRMKYWPNFSKYEKVKYIVGELVLRNLFTSFFYSIITFAALSFIIVLAIGDDTLNRAFETYPWIFIGVCAVVFLLFVAKITKDHVFLMRVTEEEWMKKYSAELSKQKSKRSH